MGTGPVVAGASRIRPLSCIALKTGLDAVHPGVPDFLRLLVTGPRTCKERAKPTRIFGALHVNVK
ncbi:hypothetical protein ACU686_26085 [Yinghuangia aomiensis]